MALVMVAGLVGIGSGKEPSQPGENEVRTLSVEPGQSMVLHSPWPVKRVSLTDTDIADVKTLTADQLLVIGKKAGMTDLMLWSEREEFWRAQIIVQIDRSALQAELMRLLPGSELQVSQSENMVVITGMLARAEQVDQMHKYLQAIKVPFVDMTCQAGVQQVKVKVRIAEVSRRLIRALGANAFYAGDHFFLGNVIGSDSGGPINPISIGPAEGTVVGGDTPFVFTGDVSVSSAATLFGGKQSWDLQVFLQALVENQYMRILAEPDLVALSGEEASFLAGGEFPIPIVQGGSQGGTSISIEYKEFGVRLKFRPTVMGDGTIRMYVAPEVSDLSDTGAVTIQGFRIPSLTTRRAETTLELKSGQTFGMAGLMNRSANARNSRIPGLGDIPILGALFRSVRYAAGETELLVLVTASLVEPISAGQAIPMPGITQSIPNDWELYGLGQLVGEPPTSNPANVSAWLNESGLERLRGPGAWAYYNSTPTPVQATRSNQTDEIVPVQAGSEDKAEN